MPWELIGESRHREISCVVEVEIEKETHRMIYIQDNRYLKFSKGWYKCFDSAIEAYDFIIEYYLEYNENLKNVINNAQCDIKKYKKIIEEANQKKKELSLEGGGFSEFDIKSVK